MTDGRIHRVAVATATLAITTLSITVLVWGFHIRFSLDLRQHFIDITDEHIRKFRVIIFTT